MAAITRSRRGSVIERMPERVANASAVKVAFVMGSFLLSSSEAGAVPGREKDGRCGERPRDAVDREQDQVELNRRRPVHLEVFEETDHERRFAGGCHRHLPTLD